jgi:hypothetical protein
MSFAFCDQRYPKEKHTKKKIEKKDKGSELNIHEWYI